MKKALSTVALGTLVALGSFGANAAIEEGQLTVWTLSDKGYNGMAEAGKRFEEDTGIKVSVAYPKDVQDMFAQTAATGDGPDILIGPHDRMGAYVQSGLLAEINPSSDVKESLFDFTWDATTVDGKIYGYPISVEAIALIYNKALVANPPKTWKEVEALDKKLSAEGKKAIMWDFKNAYFTWPMMAADGGYIYKQDSVSTDFKDAGINEAGVIETMEYMRGLMDKGVISPDMNYGVMEATFAKGETAMIINGPWGWANADKAGIDYGVANIPMVRGKSSKPMVGILAAQISTASPNRDLAQEFLENYMLSVEGLTEINNDKALGAVANKEFQQILGNDVRIAATMDSALNGETMPNYPEMPKFWDAATKSLENIASERQTVKEALADAEKAMVR